VVSNENEIATTVSPQSAKWIRGCTSRQVLRAQAQSPPSLETFTFTVGGMRLALAPALQTPELIDGPEISRSIAASQRWRRSSSGPFRTLKRGFDLARELLPLTDLPPQMALFCKFRSARLPSSYC